ncbi:hypothetical protein LINPERHAP1_LOCUS4943 [Linum perenne]
MTILTWVRLPKLPIHYFNQVTVTRIGNYIGKTVKLDLATSEGARGHYARVCVEVDILKPLLGKYMIDNRTFFIEYESLENICITCGHYGHKVDSCLTVNANPPTQSQLEVEVLSDTSIPDGDAGEWMIVQRRARNKVKNMPVNSSKSTGFGSRFDALAGSSEKVNPADLPQQPEIENQGKETDNVTSMLASQLVAVLAQATCMQKDTSELSACKSPKSTPRQPLSDASNVDLSRSKQRVTVIRTWVGWRIHRHWLTSQ